MAFNSTNITTQNCMKGDQSSLMFPSVQLRYSPSATILIVGIYLLPFCFGVFGNISVCLIFFQQKKLRSITNTFLMNLCLNDLIVLCFSIPMTLSSALLEYWILGEFPCQFLNFTPTLTALVSTFTVAVIAVERWLFIVNKKKFDRRCTIVILALLWIVSILIALPEFFSRRILPLDLPAALCQSRRVYYCIPEQGLPTRIFSYIVFTVQYLVPFLFVSISCYSISRFLKRRMKQMRVYQTHRSTNPPATTADNKRARRSQLQQSVEVTEQETTSCDDLSVTITVIDNRSNLLLGRFRNPFQSRGSCQDSIVIGTRGSRSSSLAGTIIMPTVKSQSHSERRFHRSKKLLICVAALFTVSWLPLTIVQTYLEHTGSANNRDSNTVFAYLIPAYLISSLSAWINPVIYNYINRSFRREFYALYPCCCRLTSSSSSASAATVSTGAELPSVIANRSERQRPRDLDEGLNVASPYRTSKLGARFVTFADVEKKGKPSITMINEHV